jgi:hypothetical protein
MRRIVSSGAFRALRVPGAFVLCGGVALALLAFGQSLAAVGVMIGAVLYAGNALLLVESGRALLRGEGGGRIAVALSAVGRMLLLGILLALVFVFLGRSAGLGACGGLLASQVHLVLPMRQTGVAI